LPGLAAPSWPVTWPPRPHRTARQCRAPVRVAGHPVSLTSPECPCSSSFHCIVPISLLITVASCPAFVSSSPACNAPPGCPVLRIHWLRRRPRSRVTPGSGPSAVTGDGSSRRLDFSHPSALRVASLRVAPPHRVACRASDPGFRFPFFLGLPALPAMVPRGDSRFTSFGGAD